MVVVGLDVGVFAGNILKGAPPQVVAIGQDVGLGDQRQHFFRVVPPARELEGPANAALASFAGIEGRLAGHFVGRALFQEAADAAVQIFGVLADDDKIDVVGPLAGQRSLDTGEQLHRAEIDVLIELKSQLQQQAFFQDAGLNVGVADGAQKDGVEGSQFVDGPGRKGLAGAQIAVAAEVEIDRFVRETVKLGDGGQHFEPLGNDFRTGAVAADDGDSQ